MSGAMWLNMLGLGDVAKTLNDPAFMQTVAGFVGAFQDMHARIVRVESKLDLLLGEAGSGFPDERRAGHSVTALLADLGTAGTGSAAAASGAVDDGTGGRAGAAGGAGTAGGDHAPARVHRRHGNGRGAA